MWTIVSLVGLLCVLAASSMMSFAQLLGRLLAWFHWLVGQRSQPPNQLGKDQIIVIVGAGFGGLTLTHYLESSTSATIILYDCKDYFEYTPSMLRVLIHPSHMSHSHLRLSDVALIKSPRVIIRTVKVDAITDKAVRGSDGEWQRYDKLVLAMGSDYHDGIKPSIKSRTLTERYHEVAALHSALASAASVTVFGAGLVGVELASEIKERWPEKPLCLRSREDVVLPGFDERAQRYVQAWFERQPNTRVIVNNTIAPHRHQPDTGEIVFNCTGLKPIALDMLVKEDDPVNQKPAALNGITAKEANGHTNERIRTGSEAPPPLSAQHIPAQYGRLLRWSDVVDARTHLLRTSPTLHLIHHDNIFVVGDIMIEEDALNDPMARAPKVAFQAELQAWCVSENIKRLYECRDEWRFPGDLVGGGHPAPTLIACSLGSYDGLIFFNSLVVTGLIAAFGKWFIERSKMWMWRGWTLGVLVWKIAEPITLIQQRIWMECANLFANSRSKQIKHE